jgi:hypothetical protein
MAYLDSASLAGKASPERLRVVCPHSSARTPFGQFHGHNISFSSKKQLKSLLAALISREANIRAPYCTLDVSRGLELQ